MLMPRLHQAEVTPRSVIVDGLPLLVGQDVRVVGRGPGGIQGLAVEIFCESIVLNGDPHHSHEPTPIWDQLVAERGAPPEFPSIPAHAEGEHP